jgi:hypothetical protein
LAAIASVGIVFLAVSLADNAWASRPVSLAGQTATPAAGGTGAVVAAANPAAKPVVLQVSISEVPRSITRSHPAALTVRVSNVGRRATRGKVTVTASAGKGLSIPRSERKRKIRALKAGQSRTLRMRFTLNASSAGLTVRASAAHAQAALRSIVLKVQSGTGSSPSQGNPAPANPLVGTFWWTSTTPDSTVGLPDKNGGFYFVNSTMVYSGIPIGGLPSTCAPLDVNASLPIDQQGACLSYIYDPATGVVTIGGKAAGVYAGGTLKTVNTGGSTPQQLTIEPAGFTTSGQFETPLTCPAGLFFCPYFFGLASTGQFYRGVDTPPSADPSTWQAALPPNETGTYTVNAHGSITLHFDDGTTETDTFAVVAGTSGVSTIIDGLFAFVPQTS